MNLNLIFQYVTLIMSHVWWTTSIVDYTKITNLLPHIRNCLVVFFIVERTRSDMLDLASKLSQLNIPW